MGHIEAALIFVEANLDLLLPALGIFAASLAVGVGVGSYLIVRLPADYLHRQDPPCFLPGCPRWVRIAAKVGKNLVGAVLIVAGVSLSLRAVLGPGLLAIFVGVTLLDVPGKRSVEQRLCRVPRVIALANRIRARFGRPPLEVHPLAALAS